MPLLNTATITVQHEPGHGTLGRIMAELEESGADPGKLRLGDDASVPGGKRTVGIRVRIADEAEFGRIATVLRELPEVHAVHRTREQ